MAWNRSSEGAKAEGRAEGRRRNVRLGGILAGAAVVLAGLGVWLALAPDAADDGAAAPAADERKAEASVPAAPAAGKTPGQQIREIIVARGGGRNLTPEDKAKIAELRRESAANAQVPRPPSPVFRSPFKHESDQVIAMVLTAGERVPPFPGTEESLNRSFLKSVLDPIVINDDDDEKLKELKRKVIEARQEIKAGIKEGKSVRQILEEFRERKEAEFERRREVRNMAREMMAAGEGDMVGEFVEKANEALAEEGIAPVSKPLTQEEYRQRARERRLSQQTEEKLR